LPGDLGLTFKGVGDVGVQAVALVIIAIDKVAPLGDGGGTVSDEGDVKAIGKVGPVWMRQNEQFGGFPEFALFGGGDG
jgi:hypothetical protein